MSFFGIGGGKSSSNNVSSGVSGNYSLGENISQGGSAQGASSSSTGINVSSSSTDVYGGQKPYLSDIYNNASNLYNNGAMPEKGVAEFNPYQQGGATNSYGFATGGGNDIYVNQLETSLNNLGGYGNAANTANFMSGGNAYSAPTTNGLNYETLAGAVNNPWLDGQINAASRDVTRNLYENQLTGNAGMAAGTGNSGSSRRAVMDAIAMRGAGDRVADISSTMRGNAYSTGLNLANATALANMNAGLTTNSLNADLMKTGANINMGLGNSGMEGMNSAYTTGGANADRMMATGDYINQYRQRLLDTAFENNMNPYKSLEFYKGVIGAPTMVSNSNSLGLDNSTSNSFGNSFNNAYSYDTGAGVSSNSATGSSKSWNANLSMG